MATIYPLVSTDFLELDVVATTLQADGAPSWNPVVALEVGGQRQVVYQDGSFQGIFANPYCTATGIGTEASPLHFKIRPSSGWTTTAQRLVVRTYDTVELSPPSLPSGWESRSPLRDYDTLWVTTMANLVANPTVRSDARTRWPSTEAMVILTELQASNLANYASIKANAALLSPAMRVFPGYRVGAHHLAQASPSGAGTFVFSDWMDANRWLAMTALWRDVVIPLCDADDPRVYISAENYGPDSAEPTLTSLAANGYTEAQFYAACEPFVQLMALTKRVCLIAPNAVGTTQGIHLLVKRLIEVCGEDYVQPIWEVQSDYRVPNDYREGAATAYYADVTAGASQVSLFNANLGVRVAHRRSCADDILREHGAAAEAAVIPSGAWGALAPWLETVTKTDQTLYGTPSMLNCTSLDSSNDLKYDWRLPPSSASSTYSPMSVGGAATSRALSIFRSSVQTSLGSAGGGAQFDDYDGWRISPQAPNIFAAWRVQMLPNSGDPDEVAFQYTWGVLCRGKIPSGLSTSAPFLSQAEINFSLWNLYYDQPSDSVKLKLSDGTTSTVMANPPRDTLLSFVVARASQTSWRHAYKGSSVTTVTSSAISTSNRFVMMGGGQDPAFFPANNKIMSMNNFVGQELGCWWRCPSDVEIARHLNGQYPLGITRL
jgi:hypothetical protein